MSNMSYCRFENTMHDLRDCAENLRDPEISRTERECRRELIETCYSILEEVGVEMGTDTWDLDSLIAALDEDEDEEAA